MRRAARPDGTRGGAASGRWQSSRGCVSSRERPTHLASACDASRGEGMGRRGGLLRSRASTEEQEQVLSLYDEDLSAVVKSGRYRAWLLDQFGVLHDGIRPYPRAMELCRHLAEDQGCRLVILTNSARQAPHTMRRLVSMGFQQDWFAGVATSGDVTRRVLAQPRGAPDEKLLEAGHPIWQDIRGDPSRERRRCIHFTWSRPDPENGIDLDALGIDATVDPDEADFVLVHWLDALAVPDDRGQVLVGEERIEEIVRRCAELNLPMLCANPDIVAARGDELLKMPGSLCLRYKELGVPDEKIHLMGKPDSAVYNLAQMQFLRDLTKDEVVAVGDSLEHDILGACEFGVDSCFITRGIHTGDLHTAGGDECELWDCSALETLCEDYCCVPTVASTFFEADL